MRLLIDQDGVLADFQAAMDAALLARFPAERIGHPGRRVPLDDRRDSDPDVHAAYKQIYAAPGFFAGLTPVEGALEAMHQMREAGHDVYIATAPATAYANCVGEKFAWVERHLGAWWVPRIMLGKAKHILAGDALIDDRASIPGAAGASWTHVVFDTAYNSVSAAPIRMSGWATWAETLAAVQRLRTGG